MRVLKSLICVALVGASTSASAKFKVDSLADINLPQSALPEGMVFERRRDDALRLTCETCADFWIMNINQLDSETGLRALIVNGDIITADFDAGSARCNDGSFCLGGEVIIGEDFAGYLRSAEQPTGGFMVERSVDAGESLIILTTLGATSETAARYDAIL